jgi:hypothetical protein
MYDGAAHGTLTSSSKLKNFKSVHPLPPSAGRRGKRGVKSVLN